MKKPNITKIKVVRLTHEEVAALIEAIYDWRRYNHKEIVEGDEYYAATNAELAKAIEKLLNK